MPDSQNRTVLAVIVALVAVGAVAGVLLAGGVLPDGSGDGESTPTPDAASAGVEPGDDNVSAAVEETPSPTPADGGDAADDATPTATPEPATETPTETPATATPTPEEEAPSSSSSSSGNPGGGSPSNDDDDSNDGTNDDTNDGGDDGTNDDGSNDGNDGDPAPTYTVAADGSAEYESIQAAVDDASDGDTLRVAPGTYEEQVRLAKNVSLEAPDGATLSGEGVDATTSVGIEVASDAGGPIDPSVSDFEVRGYDYGVLANGTSGDWALYSLTVADSSAVAVKATESSGNWMMTNTRVSDVPHGVVADNASGDWLAWNTTLTDTRATAVRATGSTGDWDVVSATVKGAPSGVVAVDASGDWKVSNANFTDTNATAVRAGGTTGDWTLTDFVVRGSPHTGVDAARTGGDWAVRNGAIEGAHNAVDARRSSGDWRVADVNVYEGETGLVARHTTGAWTLTGSIVWDYGQDGVDAADADGDWSVRNTDFRNGDHGVLANQTSGNWTIRNASLHGNDLAGVRATGTNGTWTVTNSAFVDQPGRAIDAVGASPAGDATQNWWGSPDGAAVDDCRTGVDCGDPLDAPPAVQPMSIEIERPGTSFSERDAGYSEHPVVSFDRPVLLADGARYDLVVNDEDAGGQIVVEPSVNATVRVGEFAFTTVPHPAGDYDEGLPFRVSGGPSELAPVTAEGEVTERGVANLSVSVRRAGTDDALATSSSKPHLLGWQGNYTQNSTTGTIEIAVNRSVLPVGTSMNATLSESDPSDGVPHSISTIELTYDPDYGDRSDELRGGAYVGTVDADAWDTKGYDDGPYDVAVFGTLPERYGTGFRTGGAGAFTIEPNATD